MGDDAAFFTAYDLIRFSETHAPGVPFFFDGAWLMLSLTYVQQIYRPIREPIEARWVDRGAPLPTETHMLVAVFTPVARIYPEKHLYKFDAAATINYNRRNAV
jgi:hypothetical protein